MEREDTSLQIGLITERNVPRLLNDENESRYIFVRDDEIPKSYGEQQHQAQMFREALKPKSFKQCQVPFGKHRGKIRKGHTIPRAWLNRLSRDSMVRTFKLNAGVKNTDELPFEISSGDAAVGFFTCDIHERLFWPVEQQPPSIKNEWHMRLLAYKAMLGSIWKLKSMESGYGKLIDYDEHSEFLRYAKLSFTASISKISRYKKVLDACAAQPRCNDCVRQDGCTKLTYLARSFKSRPSVAVCEWFYGGEFNIGITVYPTTSGQTVVLHCLTQELDAVNKWLGFLMDISEEEFQDLISIMVLQRCETVVVSPQTWDDFGEIKRNEINTFFVETMPNVGIGSVEQIAKWAQHEQGIFDSNTENLNLFS